MESSVDRASCSWRVRPRTCLAAFAIVIALPRSRSSAADRSARSRAFSSRRPSTASLRRSERRASSSRAARRSVLARTGGLHEDHLYADLLHEGVGVLLALPPAGALLGPRRHDARHPAADDVQRAGEAGEGGDVELAAAEVEV